MEAVIKRGWGRCAAVAVALMAAAGGAAADTFTWNATAAGNASVQDNWLQNGGAAERLPGSGDAIVLDDTSVQNMTWNAGVNGLTDTVASWNQAAGYTGTVTFRTLYGASGFTNFTIVGHCTIDDGVWDHTANGTSPANRLRVTVGGDLTLGEDGRIDVYNKGYQPTSGPAPSWDHQRGASHGGQGAYNTGVTPGPCYGSFTEPVTLGSGGASTGYGPASGGGAVWLTVTNNLTVNGKIISDGGERVGYASGAGGSIWLIAGRLLGDGEILARGGRADTHNGLRGGGGRIAAHLTDSGATFAGFTGRIFAGRGDGGVSGAGGAGTVYLRLPGQGVADGTLIVCNEGGTSSGGAAITSQVTSRQVRDIVIRDAGKFVVAASQTFTVEGVWSNAATVVAESGSYVAFGGDTAVTARVYGNTSFAGLECITPGKRIEFATNHTTTVTEHIRLEGAEGDPVVMRSMTDDSAWLLNVSAAALQDVDRVDVRDSDARPGTTVVAYNSGDALGNNHNWDFFVAGQTNTWTGDSNTSWGNGANWSLGRAPVVLDGKTMIPDGAPRYPLLDNHRAVPDLEIEENASMGLAGFNFTVHGDAVIDGTLNGGGAGASVLTFHGSLACGGALNTAGGEEIVLHGAAVFSGNVTFAGREHVRALGGTVDFSAATVEAAESTVTIAGGGAQTIDFGNRTFWNIDVVNTNGVVTLPSGFTARQLRCDGGAAAMTVTFGADETFAVRDFVMLGTTATNITLSSSAPGTRWRLDCSGYARVSGVSVTDSDASPGLTIYPMW